MLLYLLIYLFVIIAGVYSERIVGPSYVITQRLYVHRSLKSLIVVEVDLERSDVAEPLQLMVQLNRWSTSYDLTFVNPDSGREEVRFSITLCHSLFPVICYRVFCHPCFFLRILSIHVCYLSHYYSIAWGRL